MSSLLNWTLAKWNNPAPCTLNAAQCRPISSKIKFAVCGISWQFTISHKEIFFISFIILGSNGEGTSSIDCSGVSGTTQPCGVSLSFTGVHSKEIYWVWLLADLTSITASGFCFCYYWLSPPTGGFFLAPADGCWALRAQRWFWRTNGQTNKQINRHQNNTKITPK